MEDQPKYKADADISRSRKENTMKAKLVGVQGIHFTNNNGEEISGINIFCAFQDKTLKSFVQRSFSLKMELPFLRTLSLMMPSISAST